MGKKLTTKEFIKKAKIYHGNRYNYSKVKYVNSKTKIMIICKKHGEFLQTPSKHLMGQGCFKCGCEKIVSLKSITTKEFIKRAIKIHNNKYDYSKVEYKNAHTKITIICKKHGKFKQSPNSHLRGRGC